MALMSGTDVDWLDSTCVMSVVVRHVPQERPKTMLTDVSVVSVIDSAGAHRSTGQLRLYIRKDSLSCSLSQGDVLLVRCRPVRPAVAADGFDYGRYMQLQGIAAQAYIDSLSWHKTAHTTLPGPAAWAERVRQRLLLRLHSLGLTPRSESIVAALTLGYRDDIDAQTRSAFAASGAMHVLAVSGLHVGIVCSALLLLLTMSATPKPAWRKKRLLPVYGLIIVLLWFYACLTGLSPSVVRATLMCSFALLAMMTTRQTSPFNIVAATAFLSLAVNPLAIYSVSFQLSYSAVVSILTIGQRLTRLVTIRNPIIRWTYDLAAISIAAQLGTAPWTLYYFGFLSNYFLLTNFVVIAAAYLIIALAVAALLLVKVPFVGLAAGKLLGWITGGMFGILQLIEHLAGAVTTCSFTLPMTLLLFAAMVCVYWLLTRRQLWLAAPTAVCLAAIVMLFHGDLRQRLERDELQIGRTVVQVVGEQKKTLSADNGLTMFRWHGKTFVWVAGETLHGKQTDRPLCCDYLLTGALGRTQPEELLSAIRADTVCLTEATSRYKAAKIADYCRQHNIPHENVLMF